MKTALIAAVLTASLGLAATTVAAADSRSVQGKASPGKRTITMAAVEPKGGTTVDKEPFPQAALPEGGGYLLKNGESHPGVIEGYGVSFVVKRGQVSTVTFKADTAGVFRILCDKHHPSMHGELIVLSR